MPVVHTTEERQTGADPKNILENRSEIIEMKFMYRPYREKVPPEDLIADLIHVFARANCKVLTQEKYTELGRYNSEQVVYRFGSWNNALNQAGLPQSSNRQHSDAELFENLERVWVQRGRQPVREDMNNKELSLISSGAYLRRFGSWTNALKRFVAYMDDTPNQLEPTHSNTDCSHQLDHRSISLRMRWKVMKRDNFKCCLCGASPAQDPNVILHVDHIWPWSKGGKTSIENLRTLCSKCNLGKGNLIE